MPIGYIFDQCLVTKAINFIGTITLGIITVCNSALLLLSKLSVFSIKLFSDFYLNAILH